MQTRSFLDWVDEQRDHNRVVKAICGNRVFIAFSDSPAKQKIHWYSIENRGAGTVLELCQNVESLLSDRFGWSH
jgi:hypothetical protein